MSVFHLWNLYEPISK